MSNRLEMNSSLCLAELLCNSVGAIGHHTTSLSIHLPICLSIYLLIYLSEFPWLKTLRNFCEKHQKAGPQKKEPSGQKCAGSHPSTMSRRLYRYRHTHNTEGTLHTAHTGSRGTWTPTQRTGRPEQAGNRCPRGGQPTWNRQDYRPGMREEMHL